MSVEACQLYRVLMSRLILVTSLEENIKRLEERVSNQTLEAYCRPLSRPAFFQVKPVLTS